MNRADLRDFGRIHLQDAVAPYLWSDDEWNGFINEAIAEVGLCNRAVFDSSGELCFSQTVAGQMRGVVNPLFFRITRVTLDGRELFEMTAEEARRRNRNGWPQPGRPSHYFLDEGGALHMLPAPDAVYTLGVEGYRYPRELVNDEDECEIQPPSDQKKMMQWAFKLAKEKEDPEVERPADALRHEQSFRRAFGPQVSANQRRKQAQKPQTIRYGGL